jgi:hypothetical protein
MLTEKAATGGRVVYEAKRMWSHYFLLGRQEGFPIFVPPLREKAGPPPILSSRDYAALTSRSPCLPLCHLPAPGVAVENSGGFSTTCEGVRLRRYGPLRLLSPLAGKPTPKAVALLDLFPFALRHAIPVTPKVVEVLGQT